MAVIDNRLRFDFIDAHPDAGFQVYEELGPRLVKRLRQTDKQLFSLLTWGLKAHRYNQDLKRANDI
jgi:hypothetical protein